MNDFYVGTSAYKLEQYEEHARKTSRAAQERRAAAKADQIAVFRLLVTAVVCVFVAASALVYVNVMALRATTTISELEKDLALVVDSNKQKEIEINKNLDMKVIEKKAVEELGMQKPDNSQIVYINVKKGSYSEAINPGGKSKDTFSGLRSVLMSIKEYFS